VTTDSAAAGRAATRTGRSRGRRLSVQRTLPLALGFLLAAPAASPAPNPPGDLSFVRLTESQYRRAIHDIFGNSIRVDDSAVDRGAREGGLLAIGARKLTLSAAELERSEALAQRIAEQVIDPRRRATLIPCTPNDAGLPDDACATRFVARVGLFLFRRPLEDVEVRAYVAMANAATHTLDDFYAGLRASLVGMLVAPDFLLRLERSEPDPDRPGTMRLDAYSRAARLSFFLWDSAPDGGLIEAARSGELLTPEGLIRQVERLLNSPRLENGLRAFFSDMLGFDEFATLTVDSSLYPKFTKNVEDDAREQTLRTIVDQLLHKNRDYRELLVTRETFLTPSLAAIYGVPLARSQEMGGAVPWVPYRFADDDPRAGLLTHVSFLSLHSHPGTSSPTLRGQAVRENLLCQIVPPPPGDVDFSFVQDTNNPDFKTVRQRLSVHRENPTCAGCHSLTDPIGLTLEVFDTSGVYRTTENGAPIDPSGELNGKPYEEITGLVEILRQEPAATSCLINRAFSYGAARTPTRDERAWLGELASELRRDGVKWRDLMRRITQQPDFYTLGTEA